MSIADALRKESLLCHFGADSINNEKLKMQHAIQLYMQVRKWQEARVNDERELILFKVGCDTDQRDKMENLLLQTQGIGSTMYNYGKGSHDI